MMNKGIKANWSVRKISPRHKSFISFLKSETSSRHLTCLLIYPNKHRDSIISQKKFHYSIFMEEKNYFFSDIVMAFYNSYLLLTHKVKKKTISYSFHKQHEKYINKNKSWLISFKKKESQIRGFFLSIYKNFF